MKKILAILLCCSLSTGFAMAQKEEYTGFLFDKFEKGKIVYKKGDKITESNFNYETIMEKMLFMLPDSTLLELAIPDIVDVIEIEGRTFEHMKDGMFYEKVEAGTGFLYIRWKSKVISEGKPGPYGTKPGTAHIENISQTTSMGSIYGLKLNEDFKVEPNNIYYLKADNKFKRFDSFDSLAKQFKKHKNEIKAYVKQENLSFKNTEDIEKAVAYAFQLTE
jgi:hypothetical protein